ncbi:hypothetical protein EVAR_39495_1 [Eumeta japonica]|uniref:Uncharacterized protein n=1 Tax=Eumeta variegata TaxID=151549 RepID=A0A4C1W339_EUMVA|nr:hypothetical protein EVAR_39495_1 [Eumeta japonica]
MLQASRRKKKLQENIWIEGVRKSGKEKALPGSTRTEKYTSMTLFLKDIEKICFTVRYHGASIECVRYSKITSVAAPGVLAMRRRRADGCCEPFLLSIQTRQSNDTGLDRDEDIADRGQRTREAPRRAAGCLPLRDGYILAQTPVNHSRYDENNISDSPRLCPSDGLDT